mmetsp:Transcript_105089/g.177499  ORF Transcript_105089/g.177499 Transcript_105089/m.177499 type:complete len:207 (-) Transcript_105089:1901-2521(-)
MASCLMSSMLGFSSGSSATSDSEAALSGTFARPSVHSTTITCPTSPELIALRPVRTAVLMAWARGDPPPHGIDSSRSRAMAMDLVGGSSTSARSPWNGITLTLSRLWYAVSRRLMAAPLAASMRFRAMEPEASTQKMMRQPAGRAMRLVRTSSFSMNTLRFLGLPSRSAFARRALWNGAAARMVASTASRFTFPFGSMGLMYRPRS